MIVVPYVAGKLRSETEAAMYRQGVDWYRMLMTDDQDYYWTIRGLWNQGDTFIIIEQDIVPPDGAVRSMLDCPSDWCAYSYEYPLMGEYVGLGCAKFSKDMLAKYPMALEVVGEWYDAQHPPKHWCRVDGYLKYFLVNLGERPCVHGHCDHINDHMPSHGCQINSGKNPEKSQDALDTTEHNDRV